MQFLPNLPYPEVEASKLDLLEALFRDWHRCFSDNQLTLEKHKADDMVFDGFYPHYFEKKPRILFIGRESRRISGCHYIDVLFDAYRDSKYIGDQHLNANWFHKRMIYIAYGLLNGMPKWQDIPNADEIGDTFGEPNGLSFAFMNISKLSNESAKFQSDMPVIKTAHTLSTLGRNFIREEVSILDPEIVVTMGLGGMLNELGQLTEIYKSHYSNCYWLDTGSRRSLLIDTYHFSYGKICDIEGFYEPICEAIRRCGMECAPAC